MDKKTIIYSFKTIFKKTKLICPYCGTVQNYKKNSCCVCHKSLDSVKDNTLKIKNCIRAGIGILVLSVISVVTAMVINNALKKKPVNDNKYVQKETKKRFSILPSAGTVTYFNNELLKRKRILKKEDVFRIGRSDYKVLVLPED